MWFSGRPTTTSDQNVVTSTHFPSQPVSFRKKFTAPTITSIIALDAPRHNDAPAQKNAALPPRSERFDGVSRPVLSCLNG